MKAMWSAASGMKGLQLKIDTIGNNLANVSTYGFKKQRVEFKDLMYEKVAQADFKDGEGKPVTMEVGHGTMPTATTRTFTPGSMEQTQNPLDLALTGDGFFVINDAMGRERYTKDGAFKLSVTEGISTLVTTDGYFVQGTEGNVVLGENVDKIVVGKDGAVSVTRKGSDAPEAVGSLKLVRFTNPMGLEAQGTNLYTKTAASGDPIEATEGDSGEIWQGFLESSNVQVVDEMIQMISAQRAYELNSKTIQTADKILELAANLKR